MSLSFKDCTGHPIWMWTRFGCFWFWSFHFKYMQLQRGHRFIQVWARALSLLLKSCHFNRYCTYVLTKLIYLLRFRCWAATLDPGKVFLPFMTISAMHSRFPLCRRQSQKPINKYRNRGKGKFFPCQTSFVAIVISLNPNVLSVADRGDESCHGQRSYKKYDAVFFAIGWFQTVSHS